MGVKSATAVDGETVSRKSTVHRGAPPARREKWAHRSVPAANSIMQGLARRRPPRTWQFRRSLHGRASQVTTLKALNSAAQGCRVSGYPGERSRYDIINPERVVQGCRVRPLCNPFRVEVILA